MGSRTPTNIAAELESFFRDPLFLREPEACSGLEGLPCRDSTFGEFRPPVFDRCHNENPVFWDVGDQDSVL